MPYRLTKIYTRKGDEGYTTLGENRISKDDLLIEALGTIDELNSCIGLVVSYLLVPSPHHSVKNFLTEVQHSLFDMGGELHVKEPFLVTAQKVMQLETQLDQWNETLPPLTEFVLPQGSLASATCHLARTICRRAERSLVRLHRQVSLPNPELLRYLNRLSDLLFVAARILARDNHQPELLWEHERETPK